MSKADRMSFLSAFQARAAALRKQGEILLEDGRAMRDRELVTQGRQIYEEGDTLMKRAFQLHQRIAAPQTKVLLPA